MGVLGRLLRELMAAGELFGELMAALSWVPLPLALGLAMAARLVTLGHGSLTGEHVELQCSTSAAELLLDWIGAADFLRRWMLWLGSALLEEWQPAHSHCSLGEVLSLLELLTPGRPGQFGGVPLCAGFQCSVCLDAIGAFDELS